MVWARYLTELLSYCSKDFFPLQINRFLWSKLNHNTRKAEAEITLLHWELQLTCCRIVNLMWSPHYRMWFCTGWNHIGSLMRSITLRLSLTTSLLINPTSSLILSMGSLWLNRWWNILVKEMHQKLHQFYKVALICHDLVSGVIHIKAMS